MSSKDIINGGFFDSRDNESASSDKHFMYKQGVNVKFMSGKNVRQFPLFRILPAYDPDNTDPATSIAPWVYDDVQTTSEWLNGAYVVKCAGGNRGKYYNIVSRKTIGEPCPYEKLYRFASKNKDWEYLTKSVGRPGAPGYQAAVLPFIRQAIYINLFDPDQPDKGAMVGEFSISAAKSLYDKTTGIMWQLNPRFTEEVNSLNYMDQFNYGDLTDPENGLVLRAELQPDGKGYIVKPDTDGRGRVYSVKIEDSVLAARVDLSDIENFLNIPSEDDVIDILVEMLNQESPSGIPETALLQEVFGDTRIISPEPEEDLPDEPEAPTVGFQNAQKQAAVSPAPAVAPVRRAVRTSPPQNRVQGQDAAKPSQQWGKSPAETSYEPIPGIPGEDIPQATFDFLRSKQ